MQLFATPWTVACQAPPSIGFFQAKILEWVAISFSRGSSWPRDWTWDSCIASRLFTIWATGEAMSFINRLDIFRQFQTCSWYCHAKRRRRWHPTPVLLPGKSHGRRSLVGCSPWGREESDATERLLFDFSLSCIGEGNGNPLQGSCLENPRDGEPDRLPSMGLHRVGHDWSNLAAVAARCTMWHRHNGCF